MNSASPLSKVLRRDILKVASLAALLGNSSAEAVAAEALPNQLPAISLLDLTGRSQLVNGFGGNVVMVNFWATWCPPCRAEMPSIERLYQAFRGKPFEVLAINQGESMEKVKTNMGMFNPTPTFPILLDPKREVGKHFQVEDLPVSLLFNKKGQLVGIAKGARDYSNPTVQQSISALVNE